MSGPDENILRRKIRAAEARQTEASLQNSLVQNIEKAISKVFLDLLKVEVLAKVSERTSRSQSSTILAMTYIMFGIIRFEDDVGLCGFDANFIDTAIKYLVGGTTRDDAERAVTKTDAAIFELIINKILAQAFGPILSENNGISMQGYELGKAPLAFLLAERDYALLRVHIGDIKGANLGLFELAIPLAASKKITALETQNPVRSAQEIWLQFISKVATEAPIELDTVVQRMNLSIGRILAMKKGDMLELTDGSLGALVVEGQTANGPKVVFNGQLGALNSHKAFKVTSITDLDC